MLDSAPEIVTAARYPLPAFLAEIGDVPSSTEPTETQTQVARLLLVFADPQRAAQEQNRGCRSHAAR